ncbi:hypothetical protein BH09BAC2_BH09BAC2_16810 [soil metagenome]
MNEYTAAKHEPTIRKNIFRSLMWKLGLLFVLIISFLIYWYCYNVYSDGERTGLLTKLSRKGNVFKTYEGEMLIGNFQQSPNVMVPEKFIFSVKNEALAEKLMQLQGTTVSVIYNQYRKTLPWRGDSEYLVIDLRAVGK